MEAPKPEGPFKERKMAKHEVQVIRDALGGTERANSLGRRSVSAFTAKSVPPILVFTMAHYRFNTSYSVRHCPDRQRRRIPTASIVRS